MRNYLVLCFVVACISTFAQDNVQIEFPKENVIFQAGPFGIDEYFYKALPNNANIDSLRNVIQSELSKYPKGVLRNKARLTKIVVVDLLCELQGDSAHHYANGTYQVPVTTGNTIVVSGTVPILPGVIHHEISSVLIHELSDKDSIYQERAFQLFKRFYQLTTYNYTDAALYKTLKEKSEWPANKNNFVVLGNSGYAQVDEENDFNEIVEFLFTPKLSKELGLLLVDPNLKLWEFLAEAKRDGYQVYEKVILVIDFYNSVHPSFTETYFKGLED